MGLRFKIAAGWVGICFLAGCLSANQGLAADHSDRAMRRFQADVQPILEENCYACHGYGSSEGQVTLDGFADEAALRDHQLWLRVLKNVRAGIMPPAGEDRLSPDELAALENWIKYEALGIDPDDPDPGRVTLRRLNRHEYRYTIQDLLGYDYDTEQNFPPDDTGHGFDNIGSLLSTSPLLVEKYLQAASEIVRAVVPSASKVLREQVVPGAAFIDAEEPTDRVSCEQPGRYAVRFHIDEPGEYAFRAECTVFGHTFYTLETAQISFEFEGERRHSEAYSWQDPNRPTPIVVSFEKELSPGEVEFAFHVEPHTGDGEKPKRVPLTLQIADVRVQGPMDEADWVTPPNYERFFPRPEPPEDAAERRRYAREIVRPFVERAFRRPVDEATLQRLADLALSTSSLPGATFEQGIQQAMIAALSSRRFLFRLAEPATGQTDSRFPLIDEYSLASRLSYLLWCSMPDDELFALARRGELRENLEPQVRRMLADPKSERFVESFVGQWLRTREVDSVEIDTRRVLARDLGVEAEELAYQQALIETFLARRKKEEERFLKGEPEPDTEEPQPSVFEAVPVKPPKLPGVNLDESLRRAMRAETEACFAHVLHENRSLLELIDSDYTFLNAQLAGHYGIEGVEGPQMRKVTLPEDNPRGGVLTHAGLLMITSQSTRTSAVKRGVFVLDSILGTPAPPTPPNIPALEEAETAFPNGEPTLREMLEWHRRNPVCASCHNRMDPIGLALENFNALGLWRTEERGQPINVAGELATGETLTGVKDLRKVLVNERRSDYYRCITEKLLVYALGRGLEYYDAHAVDLIVERLERDDGRVLSLLLGVIESAPFQKCRPADVAETAQRAATPFRRTF